MLAIQAVSVALFEDRGFENVTVEEVASQSQVSPSTLYRYFGTKESLVVWDDLDRLMEAALETHLGRDEPFGDLKRAFVGAYSDLSKEELLALRRRADLIDREPALLAAQVAALHTAQEQLLPVLAKVYKRGKRDLVLEMTLRIALTALVAGLEHWQGAPKKRSLGSCVEAAFSAAEDALGKR